MSSRATDVASYSRLDARGALVALNEIGFRYRTGRPVIEALSLAVREGSVTSVVGPSGCGKTTLLAVLAGLLRPTTGSVVWSRDDSSVERHPLSMMFQKDTLLPWCTVEQNIALHFRLSGRRLRLQRQLRRKKIAELIELANLGGSEKLYPYQLSGGMRRRVAFLAAVAPQPRVLLLDEPFSSLDEPTRVEIHQDIFGIVKRYGIGTVLVTHDLGEAISLSDEVVILSARPATVVGTHTIDFGDDRNMLELREDEKFLSLYPVLWHELKAQIRRRSATSDATASPTASGRC